MFGLKPLVGLGFSGMFLLALGASIFVIAICLAYPVFLVQIITITLAVIIIFSSFFVMMYGIHKALSFEKKTRLEQISKILDEHWEKIIETKEGLRDIEKVKDLSLYIQTLVMLRNIHTELREWPIDLSMSIKLFSTSILPLIARIAMVAFGFGIF